MRHASLITEGENNFPAYEMFHKSMIISKIEAIKIDYSKQKKSLHSEN